MSDRIRVSASVSDRDLTAVQQGREIMHRGTLADLILLADELGISPTDLSVKGFVTATDERRKGSRP